MRSLLLLLIICSASLKALARDDSTVIVPRQILLVEPHYYFMPPAAASDTDRRRRYRPPAFGRPPFHERVYHPEGSKGTGLMIGGGATLLAGAGLLIAGAKYKETNKADQTGLFATFIGGLCSAGGLAMVLVGIGVNDRWHNRHRRRQAANHF